MLDESSAPGRLIQMSAPSRCAACAAEAPLSVCFACRSAAYCSKACQAAHWKARHREECPALRDAADAAAAAASAAALGNVAAQLAGTEPWAARELDEIRAHAQGGDAFAIFVLGCFVLQGARGLVPNQQRYAELMREAADAGLALAQMNLGTCYEFGRGVARVDYAMAARYYRLAAAQGEAEALHNLGNLYRDGHGVRCDLAAAFELYQRAAALGNANGQGEVARCLMLGEGVAVDHVGALHWAKLAARQGNGAAMNTVGALHMDAGRLARAVPWLVRAVETGVEVIVAGAVDNLLKIRDSGDDDGASLADAALRRLYSSY